jgi:hypothetical protein
LALARIILLLTAFLLPVWCAKRMPPPSPDRFPPRLELVRTRGRTGLELVFDEPVDSRAFPAESLRVAGPDGVELAVRGLTAARGGERVLVWTALQASVVYELTARVPDLAGNVARVRARFRGSQLADTIAPRVTSVRPGPGQTGYTADEVSYEFSEPMDTLIRPQFIAIPAALETQFVPAWDPSWQRLVLRRPALRVGVEVEAGRPGDSALVAPEPGSVLPIPTTYVALLPGLTDLDGNRTTRVSVTSFTRDSLLVGVPLHGRVAGPTPALVFVLADTLIALAATDERGVFTLQVDAGSYDVVAVSDTNYDGRADFVGRISAFVPGPESLMLQLQPEPESRAVGEYRR